jgi:hypothetical protein
LVSREEVSRLFSLSRVSGRKLILFIIITYDTIDFGIESKRFPRLFSLSRVSGRKLILFIIITYDTIDFGIESKRNPGSSLYNNI